MKTQKYLIQGLTGQDGFYLTKYLLGLGHDVYGTSRNLKNLPKNLIDIEAIEGKIFESDLQNTSLIEDIIAHVNPDYVFNFAAQSSVAHSFEKPKETLSSCCIPVYNTLEIIRTHFPHIRYYHASSSEVFGAAIGAINSSTQFAPLSPYGASKAAASLFVRTYRDCYNIFAVNGFTFNHESIYRKELFVTHKILDFVCNLKLRGEAGRLALGNLDVVRDWGYSPEYVVAMHKLLLLDTPSDCVICSGNPMSLRDFVRYAFEAVGSDYRDYVEINQDFMRKSEIEKNYGDYTEAEQLLKWRAVTHSKELVETLVSKKLEQLSNDKA